MIGAPVWAQSQPPIPTLIPPTLVPTTSTASSDVVYGESAVGQIIENGKVRLGILWNEPPFSSFNVKGEVDGLNVGLGRALATAWGVEAEFVQVTRQNDLDYLMSGQIDLLLSDVALTRTTEAVVDFSTPFYYNRLIGLTRTADPIVEGSGLANRRLGVVAGSDAEAQLQAWLPSQSFSATVNAYFTLDQAVSALLLNEVDAVVDREHYLERFIVTDQTRLMEQPLFVLPMSVIVRRQDINTRLLVNQTLQYLFVQGEMAKLYSTYLNGRSVPDDLIFVWTGLSEQSPTPQGFSPTMDYPNEYVSQQLATRPLRVAIAADTLQNELGRRLNQSHQGLAQALATRLGVALEVISVDPSDLVGVVERQEADFALGVVPDWGVSGRVELSSPYLLHGKRLLTTIRDDFQSFADLRGQWVGVFASEPNAAQLVQELGQSVNATLNVFTITRDEDAAFEMLQERNIDAIFGDSLRLLPHLEAFPNDLKLSMRCSSCDPWYTREYYSIALRRNDVDLRRAVDYALQDMSKDGSLSSILATVYVSGEEMRLIPSPGNVQPADLIVR
ncbi:MAG: substrate-binding periplasmic protein [Phototrophicaceae bacterium]